MPIDSAEPELKNVPRMPAATPRWSAGTEPMTADVFGAENRPEPMPLSAISRANEPVREVDRQHDQRDERGRHQQQPADRERAGAETVGQVAGDRAGDQEADGQRQQVDAGPQRRVGSKL